ncbi:MAG: trypsin-like peptidase domain-containing protein [Deltaproteobacteria bacterium]|nr:trypsin-like peptidase domain-containing protein [Deltaproteobacteria bacterium]
MKRVLYLQAVATLMGFITATEIVNGACDKLFSEIFREVSPAVVSVTALSIDPFRLRDRVIPNVGSGLIIEQTGLILTNAHIVYGSKAVAVTTGEQRTISAKVLGLDLILDVAAVQLALPVQGLPVVKLGDSDALQIGDDVIAIGYPFGLGQTATRGVVSGLKRVLPRSPMSWLAPFIQTDVAINPGNSGGPLVNRCGEVVGINTLVLRGAENVSFAVPINIAKRAVPQLIQHGRVIRAWHGINGKLVDARLRALLRVPLVDGFLIETIEPGSPAEKAGLQGGTFPLRIGPEEFLLGGDIITKVNNQALTGMEVVLRVVNSLNVGDKVTLEYFRGGRISSIEVMLPERPVLPGDLSVRVP